MDRKTLTDWLDETLRTADISDQSLNGLQVEGRAEVSKLAVAVDACQATIDAAADAGAGMLLVHHGLFWGRCQTITGSHGRRIRSLLRQEVNLYASHLPLDAHPTLGNNAVLARLLRLQDRHAFGLYKGVEVGFGGSISATSPAQLAQRLRALLGSPPRLLAFGPDPIRRVALVSGGGASMLEQASDQGYDALITGEGPHSSYFQAEEGNLNAFYCGHYATETLGVKALASRIEEEFGLPWVFLDHPTGM